MIGNARRTGVLPGISGLTAEPPATWHALGARLHDLGLRPEVAAPIARVASHLPEPLRIPLWRSALGGRDDRLGVAMALLMFGQEVAERKARAALGPRLITRLLRAGLINLEAGSDLRSPFWLSLVNDLFVICDDLAHGGAAVMGAGQTTADLCRAAFPDNPIRSVLDLGCGAGTVALLFAAQSVDSVGTDINPRAIALARVNAALNRVGNARFDAGDLFGPVRGQTFDLIVSQPPFVPRVGSAAPVLYLFGGARGDELPLRLLRELPPHLAPGGRAVLLIEWPVTDGTPIEQTVREAVADPSVSVLVVKLPSDIDLDEYCIRYASFFHRHLGAPYDRLVVRMRRHLDGLQIKGFQPSLVALQAGPRGRAWASTVTLTGTDAISSGLLDKIIASRDLLASGDAALLAASLQAPVDLIVQWEEGINRPGATRVRLRREEHGYPPAEVSPAVLDLIKQVDESPTVAVAADALGGRAGGATTEKVLAGVREALLRGLLEPG